MHQNVNVTETPYYSYPLVAYSILVSAQGPLVLGLGLKGLGPGLDNFVQHPCFLNFDCIRLGTNSFDQTLVKKF